MLFWECQSGDWRVCASRAGQARPQQTYGPRLLPYCCFSYVILALSANALAAVSPCAFLLYSRAGVLPCSRSVCQEKASHPSDQHQHRGGQRAPASSRHRSFHGAEDTGHPQILWEIQDSRRSPLYKRYRPKKTGEDAQISYCGQAAVEEAVKLSANRCRSRQTATNKIPSQANGHTCTHCQRRRRTINISALPTSTVPANASGPNFTQNCHPEGCVVCRPKDLNRTSK